MTLKEEAQKDLFVDLAAVLLETEGMIPLTLEVMLMEMGIDVAFLKLKYTD